jgi:two-component system, NarL family, nitrate/nitrite response regulator NarL
MTSVGWASLTPAVSHVATFARGGRAWFNRGVTDIRVVIADDHPVYCDGLAEAVAARAGLDLVGTARDGRAALEMVRELVPDVAVLDVKMPHASGLDVAIAIARDGLATRTLLLSAVDDPKVIVDAVAAGVGGYVIKDASRGDICDAIVAVAEGRVVLAPEAQTAVAAGLRAHGEAGHGRLTDREREILQMTAEGLSAARIGDALFLSPATVKTHLRSIYEKLGVSERAAAVAVAMRRGIVE